METKLFKQFEELATNLWSKYQTDIFFRTTCHIIVLQTALTVIIIIGLWIVMEYMVRDTSQTLISTFSQMLQGQDVTAGNFRENLKDVRVAQFWPAMVITTAVIISFGFIMVYVALTPTRRSLERKKRFISNISHELRTPLAIMRTNTEVALLEKNIPLKIRNMLERNVTEFDRVAEIMNNLLGLSNVLRDEHLHFEDVDLSQVAKRAMDTLAETVDHKNIALSLKSSTEQMVIGNASALEQVVFNLLKNAIAHTDSQGVIRVTIDLAADGKHVNLFVSDSGSGIDRSDLYHIFEPFYQTRKLSKKRGQGLGLAIVNEIVQMHRGRIRIQSAVGRGTTVTVSIKRSVREDNTSPLGEADNVEEVAMDFSRRIPY